MDGSLEPRGAFSEHGASVPGTPVPEDRTDAASGRPRRSGWLGRSVVGFFILLVIAIIVASFVQIPYYAITPGTAIDVAQMVTVPAKYRHPHRGGVYMTDVDLVPLRAIQYLFYRWNHADQVVSSAELTGPASSAQYDRQGIIDMVDARQAAKVVALSVLGYHVRAVPTGVVVYEPFPNTPASAHLAVGDVITSVDGKATTTLRGLQKVLATKVPGERVELTTHSFDVPAQKAHGAALARVAVRLGRWRVKNNTLVCIPPGVSSHLPAAPRSVIVPACLGFSPYQAYRTADMPFKVTIDSQGIIGPSAGLAFTLGLLDQLDGGSLTAGKRVAATGTIAINGAVGEVGGVAQKTLAVRRAGARVFFVPRAQYHTAEAHAGAHLKVVGVSSLRQALTYLEHSGGRLGARAKTA